MEQINVKEWDMAQLQFTFKRTEEKYMLTEEQFARLREYFQEYMKADPYGESTICNIYYDTKDYDLIRYSLEKPFYKEKFRVRSYGVPKENSEVFVEIKKKYDGIVYKRRVRGIPSTVRNLVEKGELLDDNKQIQNEIIWFIDHYKPTPKMFIGYERTAFFGKDDHEFRLTFDRNIRYRKENLTLEAGDEGTVILPKGKVLMELKTIDAVPMWMTQFLSKEQIYPISFSKYGTCYLREVGLEKEKESNSVMNADSYKEKNNEGNDSEEKICLTAY